MKKNKNNYFIFIILFFSFFLFFSSINANENKEFLTLKNIKVNLRQGPSFEYPIKLVYKKNTYQLLLLINPKHGGKLKILKITPVGYIFHNFREENLESILKIILLFIKNPPFIQNQLLNLK